MKRSSKVNQQWIILTWIICCSLSFWFLSGCSSNNQKARNISLSGDIVRCGTVQFSEGCSPAVDSFISYGLALVHHMTYEDAEEIFDQVVKTSPECFWGYWGKALTFIH